MRSLLLLLVSGLLLVAGCAHVPFQEPERVPLGDVDPQAVVAQFQANSPESFQLLNSVVFEYAWKSFMGIGYVAVNRQSSEFKVVCLNPLGVQLFELSGDRNSITTQNALPVLLEYGDLPTAVGNDIRRIYFDLLPAATAQIRTSKYKLYFSQRSGAGVMEYQFAGKGRDLIDKAYYENDEIIWRISYYEYLEQNGKRYPQGIILVNYKYGYQLTVRHKELFS